MTISLILLPDVITEPGKYRTRKGETIHIYDIVGGHAGFNCLGQFPDGIKDSWHHSGRIFGWTESLHDIVERIIEE